MRSQTVAGWLAAGAERFGEAAALRDVEGGFALTHRGLARAIAAAAGELRNLGIGRGDVVFVALPDSPQSFVLYLAVASVATILPVGEIDERAEYLRILEAAPAAAILMRDRPNAALTRLARERGLPLLVADPDGGTGLRLSAGEPGTPRQAAVSADDDAFLVQTSGTTAEPKIVAVTHESLHRAATEFGRWVGFGPDDRALVMMPIVHLHSFVRSSLPVLMAGGEVVWAPGFHAARAPVWIDALRPTWISAAPAIHRGLFAAVEAGWAPPRVARIGVGSDRVEPEEVERLGAVFGARVCQFYGMTETTPFVAMTPPDGPRGPAAAAGRVNPSWTVAIVDETGAPVPTGAAGEIVVAGAIVNPVFRPDGTRVARLDERGRLRTGDLGRLDSDGFLYVEGRVDDRINRGGEKIAPQPVEQVLAGHPDVEKAVVFGLPDPVLGRRVAAAVKLKEGATADAAGLIAFAAARLSRITCPERIFFTDSFPTTASGKTSRAALAAVHGSDAKAAEPEAAAPPPGPDEEIRLILARILEKPDLGPEDDFFEHGGDSLLAMEALIDIEHKLGANVSPAVFMNAATAAALARLIEPARGKTAGTRLDPVAGGPRPPLLFAYGVNGQVGFATTLANSLGGGRALSVFDCGDIDYTALSGRTLDVMALECAQVAIRDQPHGPFVVAGFSYGSQLAMQIAEQLVALGRNVAFVGAVDGFGQVDRRNFAERKKVPAIRDRYKVNKWAQDCTPLGFFDGRVTYFAASENRASRYSDETSGWDEIALGGVDIVEVEGSHHSFEQESGLIPLGPKLLAAIDGALARPDTWARAPARPDAGRLLRYEARLAAREGDLERELAACREAFAADARQPVWFIRQHAEALAAAGDVAGAVKAAKAAVAADPWPLESFVRLAPMMQKLRRRPFLRRVKAAADAEPASHPSTQAWRSAAYRILGLFDLAEEALRQGLAEAPRHLRLRIELSHLCRRTARLDEAIAVQESIVRDYPSLNFAWKGLGKLRLAAGHAAAAVEAFEAANRLRTDDAEVWQLLSDTLGRLGRQAEAAAATARAAALIDQERPAERRAPPEAA